MACFLVPATEAAVTTIAEHVVKGKEERANKEELTLSENSKTPFSHKLKWLNHMLWGGSALLAFEHIWHGEVTPWFPFLTAAGNPEDAMAMLHEMATTGVAHGSTCYGCVGWYGSSIQCNRETSGYRNR